MTVIQLLSIAMLPLIFAVTLHEAAHGWVAKQFGDPTAQRLGRVTLNPIKHIDPVGTILIPIMMLVLTNFIIGWAKPVPVDVRNFKNPKRDMAVVAAAGPVANFAMALIWALVMKIGYPGYLEGHSVGSFLFYSGVLGVWFNLILMVLNLLPIPPLDGGRVLSGILPEAYSAQLDRIEPYGLFILLFLLLVGALGDLLWPPILLLMSLIEVVFDLPSIILHFSEIWRAVFS